MPAFRSGRFGGPGRGRALMHGPCLVVMAALLLAVGGGCTRATSAGMATAQGTGALSGRVTVGPMPPGPGAHPFGALPGGSVAPLPHAKILISSVNGQTVQSTTRAEQAPRRNDRYRHALKERT